jgi:DNA-binding CsgD family transcriptional regulator
MTHLGLAEWFCGQDRARRGASSTLSCSREADAHDPPTPTAALTLRHELAELEVELDEALEQLSLPICLVDAAGIIRWQNAASIALVGRQLGLHFAAIVAPEYVHEAHAAMARKLFGVDGATARELVVHAADGRRTRVLANSVALQDAAEKVVGVLGVAVVLEPAPPTLGVPHLTPRLHETLRLLARGRSTEEIAQQLGVTRETARNYIRRLLRALGVRSRLEAVVLGRESGLID